MFEILHRDRNLKPIFTQKRASVDMNSTGNEPLNPRQFQHWLYAATAFSRQKIPSHCCQNLALTYKKYDKKAQLSLTNPRDAIACQSCSNSTCLQRYRWQYWPIFMRLTAVASEIRKIPRNSLKIQTYGVQGHPRSSILVPIESPYVTCY